MRKGFPVLQTMNAAALVNLQRALRLKIIAASEDIEAAEKEIEEIKAALKKRPKCAACGGVGVSFPRPRKGEKLKRRVCATCKGTGEPVPK